MNQAAGNAPAARGAAHSAEIEYALGNSPTNKVYAWTPDDYKVSETMQSYFANFIKTGNPNGTDLPTWVRHESRQQCANDAYRRSYSYRAQTAPCPVSAPRSGIC
jgi:carboxylesterase type B